MTKKHFSLMEVIFTIVLSALLMQGVSTLLQTIIVYTEQNNITNAISETNANVLSQLVKDFKYSKSYIVSEQKLILTNSNNQEIIYEYSPATKELSKNGQIISSIINELSFSLINEKLLSIQVKLKVKSKEFSFQQPIYVHNRN